MEESRNGTLLGAVSTLPIPVAARSKASICGRSLAEIACSSLAGGADVCCGSVLSGRSLCDELITRPEES
jgi:hypothetical protein